MFSSIQCARCGSSAFVETRGLIVVLGWTNLHRPHGEPIGTCRACAANQEPSSPSPLPESASFAWRVIETSPETVGPPVRSRRWFAGRR